ncbi:MAG: bifunctional folylpolyglutamate synthase/dihydrofolate synthase [Ignavibacteria bacterium]|jgi:dihydrofolate synthase/folylpolyglutamate synthase|nr:bifunctional folylpolyglutamate synthase/dihydrofolate synthase [Ignavibacteria bacterium]MDH7527092.1 folylpolyglutamate synthase/dihydrofolate synthase family protein [Ignavibacteria bacterium]
MNYKQSLEYLYSLQKTGIKLGLENTYRLLDLLNNPQNDFKSIHIAGTNGKGSTSSFIASILSEMNFSVGLYTSPHLVHFNERIKVNSEEIEVDYLVEMVNYLKPDIEKIKPTFFEVTTAIAFKYFSDKKVDFAVVETGLGGRLDSTNVLLPEISVITKIGYDHREYLGDTIEDIAREKAGIIKEGVPVIVSQNEEKVKNIFKEFAVKKNAEIIFADENYLHSNLQQSIEKLEVKIFSKKTSNEYLINSPMIGDFQIENLKTSIAAIERLFIEKEIKEAVLNGIKNLKFKLRGRFEVLDTKPQIILDTSHNSDAIRNFLSSLNKLLSSRKVAIFGIMRDKEIDDVIELIESSFDKIFICQAKTERSMKAVELAEKFKHSNVEIFTSVGEALNKAINKIPQDQTIVIFGSNFIVGEAIEFLERKN